MRHFTDRTDAGRRLAQRLQEHFAAQGETPADADLAAPDLVVLGLPRGGVPVAAEVARALHAPLDVLIVRKVGVPWHPELAMAAVGEEDAVVRNDSVIAASGVPRREREAAEQRERDEVARRASRFRGGRPPVSLAGRTALIIDDGIATGASMRAACAIARARHARRIVVAAPVAPADVIDVLRDEVDEVVCLHTPADFMAVGMHYLDFHQTSDGEVERLMP
ncbi:phosphoribosyltransferase [Microbacterium sp. USHLN186]|uniref:phosphoribosyltransferase n=1 Tax=Microbacterium sp. USHLN186 TaxID=3081286 RepID=UPI00301661B7